MRGSGGGNSAYRQDISSNSGSVPQHSQSNPVITSSSIVNRHHVGNHGNSQRQQAMQPQHMQQDLINSQRQNNLLTNELMRYDMGVKR